MRKIKWKKVIMNCLAAVLTATVLSGCGKPGTEARPESTKQEAGETASKKDKYIYLAGPFFNETEIKNIEYVEEILTKKGLTYFSPMRHSVSGEVGSPEWAEKIFAMDEEEILKADAVVAVYYGNYSDSGTSWECGYAYAKGIPVILVHVDEKGNSNLMMHVGCTSNVYLKDLESYDFENLPEYEYKGKMF